MTNPYTDTGKTMPLALAVGAAVMRLLRQQ
jgi:hypothetical protein